MTSGTIPGNICDRKGGQIKFILRKNDDFNINTVKLVLKYISMAGQLHAKCRAHDLMTSGKSPGNNCDRKGGQIKFILRKIDDFNINMVKLVLKYISMAGQLHAHCRAHDLMTSGTSPGNICDRKGGQIKFILRRNDQFNINAVQ